MNEAHGADEPPIPHDLVPLLTEAAVRLAADHADPKPTSVAAVATTRAKALEVVMGYGPRAASRRTRRRAGLCDHHVGSL
jgi:hypothetical protein